MVHGKTIVVTGGAGFIGSALLHHLNDLGYDRIVIVDDLRNDERWKNLVGKKFSEIVPIDQFFNWLENRVSEVQAIFHLGACSDTTERNCDYLLANNTYYTIKLAQIALKNNIRFIYASSAATYGDGALGFSDDHESLYKFRPLNMYGYSKHLVDLWLLQEKLLDKVVSLKYFNVFGPNEYHKGKMASAIVKMLPDAKNQGKISLFKSYHPDFGDGEQVRDFIYVKDVVRMTAAFLDNALTGVFNIGLGKVTSWNTLAQAVGRAINKKVPIEYIDMPGELRGKYQYYTCADMSKWERSKLPLPKYGIDEAVSDYTNRYLLAGEHL